MGSCSNRPESKEERVARFASEVINSHELRNGSERGFEHFQDTTGERIRGEMGVEKGNQFISDLRKYS